MSRFPKSPRAHLPPQLLPLTFALDFEGTTEIGGDNHGPAVAWILQAAGLPEGPPWCMAFVNRMAEIGCAVANVVSPLEEIPLGEQALVQAYVDHGRRAGWVARWEEVMPGAIFCLRIGGAYHHAGWVESVDRPAGRFGTCEGNTNLGGSPEGVAVLRRSREHHASNVYLHWWEGL